MTLLVEKLAERCLLNMSWKTARAMLHEHSALALQGCAAQL